MKNLVFIINHTSGDHNRILKRIGTQRNCNTLGWLVECREWSYKLRRYKKPKIKKFDWFYDALNFVNFKETNNE